MAKTILEEAMEDAKLLKETAIENAKNVLVEAISPKIKEFVEAQLGEAPAAMGQTAPMGEMYEEEEKEEGSEEDEMNLLAKRRDMEEEAKQCAPEGEKQEGEEGDMEIEQEGEKKVPEEEGEVEGEIEKVDEVLELSEEDIKEAFAEVVREASRKSLKTEAQVTKGFGAVKDASDGGLLDKKSGEHMFDEEGAPAAQDWTVKEATYRRNISVLKEENTKLKNENSDYKAACAFLKRNLQEVNLFNSKLLYTNKILQNTSLNNKQRISIIEAFDRAQNLREVELVYKSLSESLKIAGVLGESKQSASTVKSSKSSRFVGSSSTLLTESAKHEGEQESEVAKWQKLAGLIG